MSPSKKEHERAWNLALKLLECRSHTSFEIEKKLLKKGFDSSIVGSVISKCFDLNLIDDRTSARLYLKELLRKGFGPHKIRYDLIQKGLKKHLIDELFIEQSIRENEKRSCRNVLVKKMDSMNNRKDLEKIKPPLYRFLLQRGFSSQIIMELFSEYDIR